MERIICDSFDKERAPVWKFNEQSEKTIEFNRKIKAVNDMYAWLYEKGVLEKISFEFKDYSDSTYFAFDVKDLEPYRKDMENAGFQDTTLAVRHIFDEKYSPCLYSGAIELTWPMITYRDFDGTVSRSWECGLCKHMSSIGVLDVEAVREKQGVKAAVKLAFELSEFEPSDLVLVRPLNEEDREQVELLDVESGNDVAWGLDSEDYAWGVFLGQELVGYCTLGGADVDTVYESFKEWTCDSLCLCDVFVKKEYRGHGLALRLVGDVLDKGNQAKENVFLTVLDDDLCSFYEKLGFRLLENGTMVRDANNISLVNKISHVEQSREDACNKERFASQFNVFER